MGIHFHQGKTRVWNEAGHPVSTFWALRRGSPRALLCWEPVSGAFSQSLESCKRRLGGDSHSATSAMWGKSFCRAPTRTNHTLRIFPPSGRQHDEGVEHSSGTVGEFTTRHRCSEMCRMGGLGLCSAARGGDAACWASWADASASCRPLPWKNLRAASERLDREGF